MKKFHNVINASTKKKLLLKLIMELNIEMYIKGMLNKTIKMQLFLCHFIKKIILKLST